MKQVIPPLKHGISVIICTYNGADRIVQVLEAIHNQHVSRPVEVILIDNNSTDDVGKVASRYWSLLKDPKSPLRVILEPEQGLSAARSRGATEARYELLLYCDDDNLLRENYLEEGARLMDDPRMAVVGGGGIPVFEASPPPYLFTRAGYLACGDRYTSDDLIGARHAILSQDCPANLFGAGMLVRRDDMLTLIAIEGYPVLSDRKGNALTGGNDCEICFMLMLAGGMLLYSDDLRFDHLIPAGRMTPEYFHKLRSGGSQSREYWHRLSDCHVSGRLGYRNLRPVKLLDALLALWGRRDRSCYHRLASFLGIEFFSTATERKAMRMARMARMIQLAKPLRPKLAELCLHPTSDG